MSKKQIYRDRSSVMDRFSDGTTRLTIPCDDRTGGVFTMYRAIDGDLHITMYRDESQTNAHESEGMIPSVRIRSYTGGGDNPDLYLTLIDAFIAYSTKIQARTST